MSDGRLSYQFSSDGYIRRSVYAYDSRDDQEFIFAECCSDEIANIILEAVKRYTSTEPAHATQH
ncbi:TraS protein [Escherichia coli]|nr:TraS protein [Escherichia coli]